MSFQTWPRSNCTRERERERERDMEIEEKERVCVTGAGGYVASWLVKFLLLKGYMVHGTVRDPCDEKKNGHLKKLENASKNLQLFKTDLLDFEGLCEAVGRCRGVFHVASPVPSSFDLSNPEVEVLQPAITGTQNVLNACLKAKVNKVVVVSSVAAVTLNPNWPKDQDMDEQCWSDTEFCKSIKMWYCLGKTIAETEAIEFGRRNELNIVTICPSIVIGPMLQSTLNASSLFLLRYFKDGSDTVEGQDCPIVDVRDVAEVLLLVYEKPEADGRYICSSYMIQTQVLVEKLKAMYPNYNYPINFTEAKEEPKLISSKKLQDLGWKYRPLEETIADAVKNYQDSGLLAGKD
ncbi:cinnamoyl-CoA reductase 1-like isoform X2 [Actinidia eriantha]|uniref:cinnamoyl-CoA reductase 1-like isoform X2 n=1 Tax=Actinidia eriantha TaxID=165200 RepID=UPI002587EED2|nr:cinnamoyl-CoA reductase 1-like isoform X2 [Actinidia eriantha]